MTGFRTVVYEIVELLKENVKSVDLVDTTGWAADVDFKLQQIQDDVQSYQASLGAGIGYI